MTPCPQCGQPNNPGAMVCVRCGVALAAPAPYPSAMQATDNTQLPPWLQAAVPPQQAQSFGSQRMPLSQPGTFPNQFNQGYNQGYNQGFGGQPTPFAAQPSSPLGAPPSQAQGQLSGQSLMNDDALPDWLRNAGANMPPTPSGAPWQQQAPAWGAQQQPPAWQQNPYAQQPQPERPPMGQMPTQRQGSSPLFDDSALPEWLRQAARGQELENQQPAAPSFAQPAPPAQYGAPAYAPPQQAPWQQPAAAQPFQAESPAFPSIDQAGQFGPAAQPNTGVNAASLLDQSALPGWLGGQPNMAQNSSSANSGDLGAMSARSLVEETALPQWLRAEPDTSAPQAPPPPRVVAADNNGWMPPAAATEQPPSWLRQVYTEANVQPLAPRAPEPPAQPAWGGANAYAGPQSTRIAASPASDRLSAADFVDEAALPDWLRAQGPAAPEPERPQPQMGMPQDQRVSPLYRPGPPAYPEQGFDAEPTTKQPVLPADPPPADPPAHFAASDLIDPSALPAWAMEQSEAPQPEFNSTTGWTSKMPSNRPPAQPPTYEAGGSFRGFQEAESPASGWGAPPGGYRQAPEQFSESSVAGGNLPSWLSQARPSRAPETSRRPVEGDGWGRDVPPAGRPDDFGSRAPVSQKGRRRGPPIPTEELPPWLQGTHNGGSASQQGWQQSGSTRGMSQDADWNSTPRQSEDGFPGRASRQHGSEDKGHGWRRLFGRR